MFVSLYTCRLSQTILISLLILLLLIWVWPRQNILIFYSSIEGDKINGSQYSADAVVSYTSFLRFYSQDEPLIELLGNLTFKNSGIVKTSDKYTWQGIPCLYLESQNVSGPYVSWDDCAKGYANYLYHDVAGDLIHPPSGMRSSVPLGGIYIYIYSQEFLISEIV